MPPEGTGWLHEPKWDGFRMVVTIVRGQVRIWSRNARGWTQRLPEIVAAIKSLCLDDADLDGELVVMRGGRSDFNALQTRLSGVSKDPLSMVLFDVPRLDERELRNRPLLERKEILRELLELHPHRRLIYSAHQVGNGADALARAYAEGQEGIVSKRTRSCYKDGERNGDWLKIKCRNSDEFVVIGYTPPEGHRRGVGKLMLARPIAAELVYCGRVGTGLTRAMVEALEELFVATPATEPAANVSLMSRETLAKARWVKPHLIVEVYHQGIGNDGRLRHAALKTLRPDKTLSDLT